MKKLLLCGTAILFHLSAAYTQISEGGKPVSFYESFNETTIFKQGHEVVELQKPYLADIIQEDLIEDSRGKAYRIGVNVPVNINPENSGTWIDLPDGSKMWRLSINVDDALALALGFSDEVIIPLGAKLFVYNQNKRQVLGAYTSNTPRFQVIEMVQGGFLTLEYVAAPGVMTSPIINIDNVTYIYRGVENHVNQFTDSFTLRAESCQVDVACTPERNGWEDEINSAVHYTFVEGPNMYVCSAATINNTALDCKPYILSAWHCGERNAGSSIASWTWYWNYQKATCQPTQNGSNPSKGTQTMTGGTVRASSGNGTLNNPPGNNEVAGSDFYLVELNSAIPAGYNAYYAGWDRTNTAATSGVGIHHPAGSAKKISTYTSSLTSTTYNGGATNAHWRVIWAATTNGHGVTEGGSSGSPIFNQNGRIVGQLSGGSSFCSTPTQPDLYGKMFSNWDQNGATNAARLQPWLDPTNSNVTTLNGTYQPCSPQSPVADFVADQTTVTPATTVSFTDLSSNIPTSWTWAVSPATGWAYAGGSNANSQNPQITFNTLGQYTITLTATNAEGSDVETKNNYITVAESVGPCAATSTDCDEFIQNVSLGSINNTTACTNYGDYTAQSTNLVKGQQYTITVMPQITGNTPGSAYTNDEIAVWIDYNGNGLFTDPGEQVGYELVETGWSPQFTFTVPMTATTGSVRMRCRLSYLPDDGTIQPCGTSDWGEVEDYTVNIQDASGSNVTINCGITSDVVYQSSGTAVPNYVTGASASTTCANTAVTITQSPVAGSTLTAGANTITLTATDNCGNSSSCNITVTLVNNLDINEHFMNSVSIYPNPTTGKLYIDLEKTGMDNFEIGLYDMSGKLLFADKLNGIKKFELDMNSFAIGLYQVRVVSGEATMISKVSKM